MFVLHLLDLLLHGLYVVIPLAELHADLPAYSRVLNVIPLKEVEVQVLLVKEEVQAAVVLAQPPPLIHLVLHSYLAGRLIGAASSQQNLLEGICGRGHTRELVTEI